MTTTPAGNGASADGGDAGSGDWGWFTRAKEPAPEPGSASEVDASDALVSARPSAPPSGEASAEGEAEIPGGTVPQQRSPAEPDPVPDQLAAAEPGVAGSRSAGADTEVPPEEPDSDSDADLIRRTLAEVEPQADAVTAYFYALLFVQHPQLRDLFPASMDAQRDRLFRALLTAVSLIGEPDRLTAYLTGLGRGHRKYGTRPEHYPAVGECLLGALSHYAQNTWSAAAEAAWVRAYTRISQVMIDAAAQDELRAPAWWNAEVVSHELRTADTAVLTVRPDQPYPFLAGQYAALETPWWPRVWRHYSFAGPPRSDGLLTFHVKAVPAGWVSTALVHRVRPGSVLRLGPPTGSMTVDHSSASGLLCVGGGTGVAPLRAIVEDIAGHGGQRPVTLFYGARSGPELYDLHTLQQLAQRHRWLTLRPVVSYRPATGGSDPSGGRLLEGELPDLVRQYGPWDSYHGYLSGPPGMIRSGVNALVGSGIPEHHIRHDAVEELVAAGD